MRVGLFPGQGIPARKVLSALSGAEELGLAEEVLGWDLLRRVEVGARGKGTALPTSVAQPAIFLAGVRAWRMRMREGATFDFFAGHSLGEYTALVAAGSMSVEDGLLAVAARAEAMHEAGRRSPGAMAAVIGLEFEDAAAIAEEAGVEIANDNAPGQVVLSGDEDRLATVAGAVGARGGRSVLLEVEGAFHTAAMAPAEPALSAVLGGIEVMAPQVPVVCNVTARPYERARDIKGFLLRQLTERVLWRESLIWLWRAGVSEHEDLGPGKVVAGLAQRTWQSLTRSEESTGQGSTDRLGDRPVKEGHDRLGDRPVKEEEEEEEEEVSARV
ncbi:ACP S-malonyltransferase [soil metagenome]